MARGRGDTLAQLALKWVLAHEGVTSVIVGASRVEQLADSLQCLGGAPLRADELERMDDICRAL